jgi:MFS family permease
MGVPARTRLVLAGYGLTVFLSSAFLLVLEIVAGRLIAPYVGVSLYTWTSVIGVILAGLSLGNWIGGVWADRGGSGRSAGWVLALGGVYCLLSLPLLDWLGGRLQSSGLDLLSSSFLFAGVLFFVPAVLLGVVTPLLTTLALALDGRTGHVVGRMHALAAVGSIAGTFATGYWLVQYLGSRYVVLGVALGLMILAAPFLRRTRPLAGAALVVVFAAGAALPGLRQSLAGPCTEESSYFCIRVVDHSADAPFGEARGLVLDHLLHGINHAEVPGMLIASYTHGMDELVREHFGERYRTGLDWFFAGGGAYTQPRATLATSPRSRITVAELDPQVTETARERLFLDTAGLRVVHDDARRVLAGQSGPFDVVVGDVFHDLAIPFHLVTREFAALVRGRLAPDGLYIMNAVDAFPDPRLVRTLVKTLGTEFRHVDVWMDGVPESERVTFILTATDGGRLPLAVAARSGFQRSWYRVTEKIEALGGGPAGLPVLTDDYAPVERLIAGLLLEGGR